jgi:lipid A 3-O-deacylase
MSLEFNTAAHVQAVRVAAQWNWDKEWFRSNGTMLTGYWDLSLAQWRGNQYQNVPGRHQNITDIGFAPVFRFIQENRKGPYVEASTGPHLMSELYDNNGRRFSTAFEFRSHLGLGYVFANGLDLSLNVSHFSNASIKKPNNGQNFAGLKLGYSF